MEQVGQALLRLGAATKDKSKQEKNEEGDTQTHTHPLSLFLRPIHPRESALVDKLNQGFAVLSPNAI